MGKDNQTRERLLFLAKKEFFRQGFQDVSMRDISAVTGMALGNIYYYFKTKDEIFVEILRPVLKEIDLIIDNHNKESNLSVENFPDEHKGDSVLWHFSQMIANNRAELRLLFWGAQGSSLESFSEKLIQKITLMGINYIGKMKERYPNISSDIDLFFIHVYAAIQMTIIKELVLHDEISGQRMKSFSRIYSNYTRAGWKLLMRV